MAFFKRSPKWGKANDQYCNNVALKWVFPYPDDLYKLTFLSRINSRIGGTNSVIMSDATSFLQTCMVVGARFRCMLS